MELPQAYNAPRIDDVRNRVIRTIESENFVRMLVKEIKPLAERSVYLTLGAFSDRPEADCRPLTVGLVDVRDEAPVLLTKLWSFPFASHDGFPYVASKMRFVLPITAAVCNDRRRIAEEWTDYWEINGNQAKSCERIPTDSLFLYDAFVSRYE